VKGDAEPACAGDECAEALAQLEAYLDGELPDARQEDIESHLKACYPCTDRASFEEQLRAIVRSRCIEEPPARLLTRIQEHLDTTAGTDTA
jgi:anti-sigma factor (TIGR02949 family)